MDTKFILFAQIVEDFSDVKKLYQDGEAEKAFKLYEDRLKEIKCLAQPSSGTTGSFKSKYN